MVVFVIPLAMCSFFMIGDTVLQLTGRISILAILGVLIRKLLAYSAQAQLIVGYPNNKE